MASQWMTIGMMILCGLGMGTTFDVYRVASHRFHVARWLLPGFDVVYWALATFCVFNILLGSNQGEVRMYVFLGLGIGVTGYFGMFSSFVIKLSGWIIDRLKQLFYGLWKMVQVLLLKPVLWIVRIVARLLDVVFIVTAAIILWVVKLLYKPVAAIGRWSWKKLLPIRKKCQPVVRFYFQFVDKLKQIIAIFRKKS
ncbi:MAG: spore cortex biosynthesis protein YabQ [Candidatus Cohnella colombiensis]|uniref:Spore cortex biosynthesis protein YabQ n=1 Tax=Candidatus Cohnella colombiensis TaxID=3121368 RepID=A0AA95F0S1_9BACL|nr:MAG: spore cortex biosynthesis protein YabQ [Cohnella sp.]